MAAEMLFYFYCKIQSGRKEVGKESLRRSPLFHCITLEAPPSSGHVVLMYYDMGLEVRIGCNCKMKV